MGEGGMHLLIICLVIICLAGIGGGFFSPVWGALENFHGGRDQSVLISPSEGKILKEKMERFIPITEPERVGRPRWSPWSTIFSTMFPRPTSREERKKPINPPIPFLRT